MEFELTAKNYRCFPDSSPATIHIRPGFTALVGANSSGKSAFLTFVGLIPDLINCTGKRADQLFPILTQKGIENFHSNRNDRPLSVKLLLQGHETSSDIILDITVPRKPSFGIGLQATYEGRTFIIVNSNFDRDQHGPLPSNVKAKIMKTLYCIERMLYIGAFRTITGAGDIMGKIEIGSNFVSKWNGFKSGDDPQDCETAYKLTEDICTLLGFQKLEINSTKNENSLQVIINGKSYDISQVGTGVSQVILTLTHAAIHRPSYVLIDEPELNLHPSLQLDFLATLGNLAEHGVIFSTHNIGLARAAANRIYSFRLDDEGTSLVQPFEATPGLAQFLGEVSYSLRSDLGCQRVLLVEGTSDVLTFRQFLQQYGQDHKIVILPLGGSSLIKDNCEQELAEVNRIADEVYCVIDSEKKSADDTIAERISKFEKTCVALKIKCLVLERRATENYLTEKAIRIVKKSTKYSALGHFEKLSEADFSWAKSENWRIAQHMTKQNLDGTDLGRFLEKMAQSSVSTSN